MSSRGRPDSRAPDAGRPQPASGSAHAPTPRSRWQLPNLGLGLGLRPEHVHDILDTQPDVGWFEVITENVLHHEGWFRSAVDAVRERYPVVLHGVSLSIGSSDPLPLAYLRAVKTLADELEVAWVSDHVCWTGVGGRNSHDLLPVPYDERSLRWIVDRVRQVQEILERPIMLENPSSYLGFTGSTLTEWDFHARLAREADCGLLLDVNNVFVSSVNHGFDPGAWLAAVPWDRVAHLHVAGHSDLGTHLLDTHIGPVCDAVWQLLGRALQAGGPRPVMLEWDDEIPAFAEVWQEAQRAQAALDAVDSWSGRSTMDHVSQRDIGSKGPPLSRGRDRQGADQTQAELAQAQTWLFDLVSGQPNADTRRIASEVTPTRRLTAAERVDIYRDMIRVRFLEAMELDFVAVQRALGEERFAALVARYLRQHPSQHWALEQLGAAFPGWLRSQADEGVDPAWIADAATLEWALVRAGWPPEQPVFDTAALAAVPPESQGQIRLQAAATTELWDVSTPAFDAVARAWGHAAADTPAASGSPAPSTATHGDVGNAVTALVYRDGWQVKLRALPATEAAVLRPLVAGASLAAALEAAAAAHDIDVIIASLGSWTQRWARERVLTGLASRPATRTA